MKLVPLPAGFPLAVRCRSPQCGADRLNRRRGYSCLTLKRKKTNELGSSLRRGDLGLEADECSVSPVTEELEVLKELVAGLQDIELIWEPLDSITHSARQSLYMVKERVRSERRIGAGERCCPDQKGPLKVLHRNTLSQVRVSPTGYPIWGVVIIAPIPLLPPSMPPYSNLRQRANALASGRTPGSARKHARNVRNDPLNDKNEFPHTRLDEKPRNNKSTYNHWGEMKGMTTTSGTGGDGTGCLDRHRSSSRTDSRQWREGRGRAGQGRVQRSVVVAVAASETARLSWPVLLTVDSLSTRSKKKLGSPN
ncbi:hypothetical protein EYF80_008765 [Liparis tanakae]|uniref:Uncharacterized protein n=1 Tax=Liparis tanakae TaxID=230148 RepID=A0A4Z2ISX2_9TELE|nr:hypothetical protein EYF80_008765 [Liparis tanakae]